jgi:hypothetical protein
MSIFITERQAQRTELIRPTAIEAHILTERFKNEVALCN